MSTQHTHLSFGNVTNIKTRSVQTTRGPLVGLFYPNVPGCPLALATEDLAQGEEFPSYAKIEMVGYRDLGLHEVEGLWPDAPDGKGNTKNTPIAVLSPADHKEPTSFKVSAMNLPDPALKFTHKPAEA